MKNESGITLVEVVIGLALLSGAIMTATASFISISRLQAKTATVRSVQQSGRFVMDDVIRNIRNASVVTVPTGAVPGTCISLAGGTGAATPSITYAFVDGMGLVSNATGSCASGTSVATGDTRITKASLAIGQPVAGVSKQFVTVDLTINQGNATLDHTIDPYAYSYDLTTTVELREQP